MLYALSSGTSHSAQYAMAAMHESWQRRKIRFRKEISVHGDRAHKLKEYSVVINFMSFTTRI